MPGSAQNRPPPRNQAPEMWVTVLTVPAAKLCGLGTGCVRGDCVVKVGVKTLVVVNPCSSHLIPTVETVTA